jgi:hypothetical protein
MANNRMYLVNKRTATRIYLAKYYPSTGWYAPEGVEERLSKGFDEADFGHLTEEQLRKNAAHIGFGVPHISRGGMWGNEWKLELESDEP